MSSARIVRAALALALAMMLGGTLLSAPSTAKASETSERAVAVAAKFPGCYPKKCWTAISFNSETLRSGSTRKGQWGSKKKAMQSAFQHCKARPVNAGHRNACKPPKARKVYNQGGCVAVAWRVNNGTLVKWAVGKAFGPIVAQRKARKAVRGPGTVKSGYSCPPRKG